MSIEPFEVELPSETRRMLDVIAEAGLLGGTADEVASYLICRGLDDMMRAGVLSLSTSLEKPHD